MVTPSNLAKLLFDSRYYSNRNPDVRSAVSNGLFHNGFEHFIKFGLTEGREPSATFAGDYLTNNPDVSAAVNNRIFHSGFEHFIKAGLTEGREPDPLIGDLGREEVRRSKVIPLLPPPLCSSFLFPIDQ